MKEGAGGGRMEGGREERGEAPREEKKKGDGWREGGRRRE